MGTLDPSAHCGQDRSNVDSVATLVSGNPVPAGLAVWNCQHEWLVLSSVPDMLMFGAQVSPADSWQAHSL